MMGSEKNALCTNQLLEIQKSENTDERRKTFSAQHMLTTYSAPLKPKTSELHSNA
jgi:hypothetical protein